MCQAKNELLLIKRDREAFNEMKKPKQAQMSTSEISNIFETNKGAKKSLTELLSIFNFSKLPEHMVSASTFRRFIKRKRIASYRKPSLRSENLDKPGSKEARRHYLYKYLRIIESKADIYYVDESTFSTKDFQGRMWLPLGKNQHVKFKARTDKLNVFCAASPVKGTFLSITKSNGNKHAFKEFLKQVSEKFIGRQHVGNYVEQNPFIMFDNSSIHKAYDVRDFARSLKINLVFLPAYSPELNAAENVFALLKAAMRKLPFKCESVT